MRGKIKHLIPKESEAISKLKLEIQNQIGSGVEMILFGSKARGDSHEESDIDILVLVDREVNSALRRKIRHIAWDIEFDYNFEIDFQIVIFSKAWWESVQKDTSFAMNVQEDGIRL